ncbi:hypothetical protein CK203_087732 [Vitis vinifera]|uniref:Uncharacterized protein n=1 Tax=Vitis vinifera TaxID=29760 RepID=A0A438DPH3_VITVI|nr:hypothetical protein CK203_087732 [Vitis vinifera]
MVPIPEVFIKGSEKMELLNDSRKTYAGSAGKASGLEKRKQVFWKTIVKDFKPQLNYQRIRPLATQGIQNFLFTMELCMWRRIGSAKEVNSLYILEENPKP